MHRTALMLLCSLCLLVPRAARADVLTDIKDWFSKLGKPKKAEPEKLGAQNTFTLNPLALRHRQLGVEYERVLGKAVSLAFAPEFAYGRAADDWHLSLAGTLGTRLFVLGDAPSGIFFGPELSMSYERSYRGQVLRKGFGLGLGGSVGWSLVLFDRLTVSVGFSAQYRSIPDLDSPNEDAVRVEIVPTPRLAFGVAF